MLGARGKHEGLRAKPVGPAGEVSCESGGWARARVLVVTTGPLIV